MYGQKMNGTAKEFRLAEITFTKKEIENDRILGIHTCEIQEWDGVMFDYHRGEPTPYRALEVLIDAYDPPEDPFLIDYGSALGRINFYFHHRLQMPGIGLEVDRDRFYRAGVNKEKYALKKGLSSDDVSIDFLEVKAEEYFPPPNANVFYFFHPFSDWIFRLVMGQILRSIDERDRTVDLLLYYPSFQYFQAIELSGMFEEILFVDCGWNKDPRDGFWVFRHQQENALFK